MNSISSNKEYSLLNKQLTPRVLIYLLVIIASNLIASQSFAAFMFEQYKDSQIRKTSYDKIITKFETARINEFAQNGYFLSGESHPTHAIIQCFSCGAKVYAALDNAYLNLQRKHRDDCKHNKIILYITSKAALESQKLSLVDSTQLLKLSDGQGPEISPPSILESPSSNVLAEPSEESSVTSEDSPAPFDYENIDYDNICQKICQNNKNCSQDQRASWDRLYNKLKSMKHLCLGVSFNMCAEESLFPDINTNYHNAYLASGVGRLKSLFFHQNNDAFLCLSLMMELERKLQSTISHIESEQHKVLVESFKSSSVSYYHPGFHYWYSHSIRHVMNDEYDLIDDDVFLSNVDVGVLFYALTRFLLLENRGRLSDLDVIIENCTKLHYEKVITRRFYKYLALGDKPAELKKELLIPGSNDIAFIESMRICAFYAWDLFENIKNNRPFPTSVDPRKIRELFSLEYIKKSILKAAISVFSSSVAKFENNIINISHKQCELKITQNDIDKYKIEFINIFERYYSDITEEIYVTTIFPGANGALAYPQTKKDETILSTFSNDELENE